MLDALLLKLVGPSPEIDIRLGHRLNVFTGDNGLGKTFLLDVAWWAMTGSWADSPAFPQRGKGQPEISYWPIGKIGRSKSPVTSCFDFSGQAWPRPQGRPVMPGLIIYARVDGGFSVWDPARNYWKKSALKDVDDSNRPAFYDFSPNSLWRGLEKGGETLCNGLIRDWVTWQHQPDQDENSPFSLLCDVLKRLSPEQEQIKPGKPTRVSITDVKDIPTIVLPYGEVPVTLASAGMKRIMGLAYLLVWTWYEHVRASELLNQAPADRLVLLMDEVESHLHPQWQRLILPAILDVSSGLKSKMETQVFVTTHSPMILASLEPFFNESDDRLFLFKQDRAQVSLEEVPWAKQGDAVGWLTSETFGLPR